MDIDPHRLTNEEFQAATQHLDHLVHQFEHLPLPDVQDKVFELLQVVDSVHREGLVRLVNFLCENGLEEWVERAAQDPAVNLLLVVYDLVTPEDPVLQAERALDTVRPYINSHGGEVELLDVLDGVVHLRLNGSCNGCAGSTVTLTRGIETALREGFPGYKGIEVHEPEAGPELGETAPGGLITFEDIQAPAKETSGESSVAPRQRLNAPVFETVAMLNELPPGSVKSVNHPDVRAMVVNVAGEVYAVGEVCPGSDAPLSFGFLDGATVTCPWHNEVYDVRSGKCLDPAGREDSPRLPVFPVAIRDGDVRVAVNVAPRPILQASSG